MFIPFMNHSILKKNYSLSKHFIHFKIKNIIILFKINIFLENRYVCKEMGMVCFLWIKEVSYNLSQITK